MKKETIDSNCEIIQKKMVLQLIEIEWVKISNNNPNEPKMAKSSKSGPGSIGAVGRCEGEGKVHHSFNICPKALHGSPKQCYNTCVEELGSTKTFRLQKE